MDDIDMTKHMAYRTPYSRIVWQSVVGTRMYRIMRIGYILINIKVFTVTGTALYMIVTGGSIPMFSAYA